MKKVIVIISSVLLLVLCGCGGYSSPTGEAMLISNNCTQTSKDIVGKWASDTRSIITFDRDGSCTLFGEDFSSYSFDGALLNITENGRTYQLGARLFKNNFVLFKTSREYSRVSGDTGLLRGEWLCESDGGSFSFDGTNFVEDSIYCGAYCTDMEEIILIYDECGTYSKGDYTFGLCRITEDDRLIFYYGWVFTSADD